MPSSGGQTCALDRKSTRLNSSHTIISYAVFCLKKQSRHSPPSRPSRPARPSRLSRPFVSLRAGSSLLFFFNDTATTEISTLSLHDALPINDTATTEIYTLSLHELFRSRWSPYHYSNPTPGRGGRRRRSAGCIWRPLRRTPVAACTAVPAGTRRGRRCGRSGRGGSPG